MWATVKNITDKCFEKIDFYLTTTATYREYAIIRKLGGMSFVKNYLLEDGDLEGLVVFNKKDD